MGLDVGLPVGDVVDHQGGETEDVRGGAGRLQVEEGEFIFKKCQSQ